MIKEEDTMKLLKTAFLAMLLMVLVGTTATAQVDPQKGTGSLIMSDTGDDLIFRLTDFDLDGDFDDPGEIILFYDATDPSGGSSNPIKIKTGPLGYIYVGNTSLDTVVRLMDLNGNGDAADSGEATIYIDNTNASGVVFSSTQGMAFDTNGDLWLSNSSSGDVNDFIARARDLNADGDCQDAGEIEVLYDSVEAQVQGLSIILNVPMPCVLDENGYLYVSDVNDPNGDDPIIRMKDLNDDGDMYDLDEVTMYYDDLVGSYDFRNVDSLAFTHDGKLLMNESLDDIIYIGEDANSNGRIDDLGEVTIYRDGSGARPDSSKGTVVAGLTSLHWDVFLAEYGDPDGAHGLRDLNSDGDCDDPDELKQVYDETLGDLAVGTPKGLTFMRGPWLRMEGVPQIGATVDVYMAGTIDYTYRIAWSLSTTGGTLIPPIGMLYLGTPYQVFAYGTIPANGEAMHPISIPNNPAIVGWNVYVQGLVNDSYLHLLSNDLLIVIL